MEIFQLASDEGVKSLRRFLYGAGDIDVPFKHIIEHVKSLGAASAVVEPNYVDRDFIDEYSYFYSKTFKRYENKCIRVHFFSAEVDESAVAERRLDNAAYLGFFVLRPTDFLRVGRTILKPPIKKLPDIGPLAVAKEETERPGAFALCQATFTVNLYGNSLSVKGTPFMQQDKQVGACAHVGLWMAARYLHQADGYAWNSTVDIAQKATTHWIHGKDVPAGKGGLDLQQLADAVRQLDMQPLVYVKRKEAPHWDIRPQEIIYRYVESGLPVLLLLILEGVGHVVCAIGHTYDHAHPMPGCYDNVAFVPDMLVHNDEKGPYCELPMWGPIALNELESILVLLPKKVFLKGEDADSKAKDQVTKLKPTYYHEYAKLTAGGTPDEKLSQAQRMFDEAFRAGTLFYRTYLTRSNKFKNWIVDNSGVSPAVKAVYCRQEMPKHVWITELSVEELLKDREPTRRLMLGEIIQDATANSYGYTTLAAHFPGCVITFNPNAPASEPRKLIYPIADDSTYRHLSR